MRPFRCLVLAVFLFGMVPGSTYAADHSEPLKALGKLKNDQPIAKESVKVTVPADGEILDGQMVRSTLVDWNPGQKMAPSPRAMGFPGRVQKTGAGAHMGFFDGHWRRNTPGAGKTEPKLLTWDMPTAGTVGCLFTIAKILTIDAGSSGVLTITPDPNNKTIHTEGSHALTIIPPKDGSADDLTCTPLGYDCKNDSAPWQLTVTAKALKLTKDRDYTVLIDGTAYGQKIKVTRGCEFELSATTVNGSAAYGVKDKLYFRYPDTSATVKAKLTYKGKHCPKKHTLTVTGGSDPLEYDVICPTSVGGTVSQKIDTFPLNAADYAAKLAASEKPKIFTINPRLTINQHRDTIPAGVEVGLASVGQHTVAAARTTTTVSGSGVQWTAVVSTTIQISYTPGTYVNYANPGQKYAWAAAEIAKAPSDETAMWIQFVAAVEAHEQGHVSVWSSVQAIFGSQIPVSNTGTGTTRPLAIAAATSPIQSLITNLSALITSANDFAQAAYHIAVGPTVDLPGIPGRD